MFFLENSVGKAFSRFILDYVIITTIPFYKAKCESHYHYLGFDRDVYWAGLLSIARVQKGLIKILILILIE